jgi:hypothetical protein
LLTINLRMVTPDLVLLWRNRHSLGLILS